MTAYHPALRLTPSNSPYFRSPSPRSPTKQSRSEEPGLQLIKIIGHTTTTPNAFDHLPDSRTFAFTAGSAAVLATVDDALHVTQRFYRANPGPPAPVRDVNGTWPLTPTPSEARHKTVGNIKEHSLSGSPLAAYSRDWADSPSRTTSAKDRVKAATSVALSPNGKWLAVGETGYKPRILIFAIKDEFSAVPVYIMSEHTFGVHALRFSPDSKSLASLGTVNDGFLFVWSIDDRTGAATLSASNKCTTLIRSMSWMGRSIVTVGLRYVKVWRPDEDPMGDTRASELSRANTLTTPRNKLESRPSDFGNSILHPRHRALVGKNSLLGELLDATFVTVVAVDDSKAIICTEAGEICFLDDRDRMQSLALAVDTGVRITAARVDHHSMLHTVGPDKNVTTWLIPDIERRAGVAGKTRRQSDGPIKTSSARGQFTVACATIADNFVVEIDSDRAIRLSHSLANTRAPKDATPRELTAHGEAVLGVRPFCSSVLTEAAFITFSAIGLVHFWNEDGTSVYEGLSVPVDHSSEMYGLTNELKAIAPLFDGKLLSFGDRYGSVGILDIGARNVLHRVRAHSAEVLDLLAFQRDGVQYLVSASRDRTVQLFVYRQERLELLQTMDEHAGAVTGLLLSHKGEYLLSCSADRTIVVRQSVLRGPNILAFAMVRAITLKSSLLSMCPTAQEDTILVSTADRVCASYSIKTGQPGFSFKCSDNEGGEAVSMSKVLHIPSLNGNPTIAGISSSDKSVRLYSEYGTLIARDWGHTEGITDIAIVSAKGPGLRRPQIATVAADSTIFLWDSIVQPTRPSEKSASVDDTEKQELTAVAPLGPPLRRVISHSEMRFHRDRLNGDCEPTSPTSGATAALPSPQKVRKKSSKASLATPIPKLEPGFRANFDPSRRKSMRQRSPSPPSPRNVNKKEAKRRPSLGISLRSKSTDNLVSPGAASSSTGNGFGTLTASTESVCRTLRAYRKKLVNSSSSEAITPEALRELEKELKLTARVVGEKSQSRTLDEAVMARLLDQASDKIADLLDEKIRARAIGESPTPTSSNQLEPLEEHVERHVERSDTAPGALET